MSLSSKIDFALIFSVSRANPNGDPLNGNRPRTDYAGHGEISDVCLKRKLRNRLQDMGERIFVQSDERRDDGYRSLKDRADGCAELKKADKAKDYQQYAAIACERWIDVRAFGQVFAFGKGEGGGVSVGVRGPVSIQCARSVDPVDVSSMQITKSVNLTTNEKEPDKKGSDTMGMKHRVDFGLYVAKGSINTQLAEKTGFSDEDAEKIRQALLSLFENDASSARPEGSMEVIKLIWWEHGCPTGKHSSAKVHGALTVRSLIAQPQSAADYEISVAELPDLHPQVIQGV